jgi:hypothetical protein
MNNLKRKTLVREFASLTTFEKLVRKKKMFTNEDEIEPLHDH